MRKNVQYGLIGLLCIIINVPFTLFAQSIDTLQNLLFMDSLSIPSDVKSQFLNVAPGIQFDAKSKLVYKQLSLDHFLNNHSAVFVKNFGVNSISSLSLRGTAASQSQILWEGVPINSASTGIGDLSLYTTGLFDDIEIKYGSTSPLYGSGNIGGTLLLKSAIPQNTSFQANIAYGSFGNIQGLIKADINSKVGQWSIKAFGNSVKNNFTYFNDLDQSSKMTNAFKNEWGGIVSYAQTAKLFSKTRPALFSFHTWLQATERAIPPALFENISVKIQEDASWRNVLNINQALNQKWQIYSKTAYSREQFVYNDSLAFIHQQYGLQNVYNEIGISNITPLVTKSWQHHFVAFMPLQYNSLHSKIQHRYNDILRYGMAIAYQIRHTKDNAYLQLSLRKEWQEGLDVPYIYNISVGTGILKYQNDKFDFQLPLYVSLQNSYRIPTLNELYYFPGGNLHLKPEYGINKEAGFKILLRNRADNYWQLKLAASYFDRDVKDWIYWLGVSIWTPYNIATVYSRGWDYQLKWEKNIGHIKLYAATDYTYTISTTEEAYLPNNNIIGKQIPYTPRYLIRNNVGIQWGPFLLNASHSYMGYRFTNLDESSFLPPYQLLNLQSRYGFSVGKAQLLSLQLMVNNLLNTPYESVNQRPMPLRNYLLSISYNW